MKRFFYRSAVVSFLTALGLTLIAFALLFPYPVQAGPGDPDLTVAPISLMEGDVGQQLAVFTVNLSQASTDPITATYATTDSTATQALDYTAKNAILQFNPGQVTQQISIPILGDDLVEADETFLLNWVTSSLNVNLPSGPVTATILNDDYPLITIADGMAQEGDAGITSLQFQVSLNQISPLVITVNYSTTVSTQDDAAQAGIDFISAQGQLVFNPGEKNKLLTIQVRGDTQIETDEIFLMELSSANNASLSNSEATGVIQNDDLPNLTISDATANEGELGSPGAVFTVTLSEPSPGTVRVGYLTSNGTASAPNDFSAINLSTLTFLSGDTSENITVTVKDDQRYEGTETFSVTLSAESGANILRREGIGTILDDENQPVLSIDDVAVTEGMTATFTLRLSNPSDHEITVRASTLYGSARAEVDYLSKSQVIHFQPGALFATFTVATINDDFDEANENFIVTLTEAVGARVDDMQGLGRIHDDDGSPSLSITNEVIVEGDTGSQIITFTVDLSPTSGQTVSVQLTTSDGSARSLQDYTSLNGYLLVFAPGETSKQVGVEIQGDQLDEPDENFFVDLATPTNANVADWEGIGTIIDNDSASLRFSSTTNLLTNESGLEDAFGVSLESKPTAPVTVTVASSDTGEMTLFPETLFFDSDSWSTPQVVHLRGIDDPLQDGNTSYKVFFSTVSSDARYHDLQAQLTGTNADNDTAGITVNPTSGITTTEEGATAQFEVLLNTQPLYDVTLALTSTLLSEGIPSPTLLSFTPLTWNQPQTVTVTGVEDFIDDQNHPYSITLQTASSQDVDYDRIDPEDVSAVNLDNDGPDMIWISPTLNTGGYHTLNEHQKVTLKVAPIHSEDRVRKVRFIWWNTDNGGRNVEVGLVEDTPFEVSLDPRRLNFGFNQFWVIAYDQEGYYTTIQPTIFVYRPVWRVFLPWVRLQD